MNKVISQPKNIFLFFVAFMVFTMVNGQQEVKLVSEKYSELRYYPVQGKVFHFSKYSQIQGNPFMNDDWTIGAITLANGETITGVKYKLDIYAHELVIYHEYIKRIVHINKEKVSQVEHMKDEASQRFVLLKSVDTKVKNADRCFFELLSEHEHTALYKLHYKELESIMSTQSHYLDKFLDVEAYYLAVDQEFNRIKLHRRFLLRTFPEYKREIRQYIRNQNLKIRNEDDFIQTVQFLDELIKTNQ